MFKKLAADLGDKPKMFLKGQTVLNEKRRPNSVDEASISYGEPLGIIVEDTRSGVKEELVPQAKHRRTRYKYDY